jgi:hypothetical protein
MALPNVSLFILHIFLHFTINTLIKYKKFFLLKNKIVKLKTTFTINKFIITFNFLKTYDLINKILYLGTKVVLFDLSHHHACLFNLCQHSKHDNSYNESRHQQLCVLFVQSKNVYFHKIRH